MAGYGKRFHAATPNRRWQVGFEVNAVLVWEPRKDLTDAQAHAARIGLAHGAVDPWLCEQVPVEYDAAIEVNGSVGERLTDPLVTGAEVVFTSAAGVGCTWRTSGRGRTPVEALTSALTYWADGPADEVAREVRDALAEHGIAA